MDDVATLRADAATRPERPPDLGRVAAALGSAAAVIDRTVGAIAATCGPRADPARDPHGQVVLHDVAHAASALAIADATLVTADQGPVEARLAAAFAAEAVHDVASRLLGRAASWHVERGALDGALAALEPYRDPGFLADLATAPVPRHLPPDLDLVRATFRRFAAERVLPVAEAVHRDDGDVPEEVIRGLAELGTFGLSIDEADGGWAVDGDDALLAMVVATEELSRASLGVAGSLVTRPEILARALVQGGTEEQRETWLPRLASGEVMAAVAVTEPDHGSDSGGVRTTAERVDGGYLLTGVKTWCTFAGRADVLMVLARTDPDRALAHRGLSLFVVSKPPSAGHAFRCTQEGGGAMEGRAIPTIGYRGMHSFEVVLDRWFVPADHLVGGDAGVGRGFALQMQGFENGRLQTAARALGVMQAAHEHACAYAAERSVFGRPLGDYELTRVKVARMAAVIHATREHAHHVARLLARGGGAVEASMAKAHACRAAEWVTREAQQIHGGTGYAEESVVARLFVDARVLSIFEGAEEILTLGVIAKDLLRRARDGDRA